MVRRRQTQKWNTVHSYILLCLPSIVLQSLLHSFLVSAEINQRSWLPDGCAQAEQSPTNICSIRRSLSLIHVCHRLSAFLGTFSLVHSMARVPRQARQKRRVQSAGRNHHRASGGQPRDPNRPRAGRQSILTSSEKRGIARICLCFNWKPEKTLKVVKKLCKKQIG